ncbi:hypothetical protein LS70_008705 [Helicobacter sp. MIT 11-5569]|jgi:murein lipoprotein|uniref:EexN family lipoprotein n=1 Tax=Helicobacter TaxID=209 RepID=UPI00047BC6DF|nr:MULTISPECIES: EexN family lipoprotein [Helicobacter]TLD80748.1 hypothetical protein LS70_008705 [Helicobacter sp. MIT 11-5569]
MKRAVKLGLLGAIVAGVFSACSSEPKSVEYYSDPKNAKELEAKVAECKKKFPEGSEKLEKEQLKYLNGNPSNEYADCENAYSANFMNSVTDFGNITDEDIAKHFKRNNNQKSQ